MSHVKIPVKLLGTEKWGCLQILDAGAHFVVAENVDKVDENFSFIGGHRVRKYRLKKNVHFKIPASAQFDISGVTPAAQGGQPAVAAPVRRKQGR
jgi:hypothetical protein